MLSCEELRLESYGSRDIIGIDVFTNLKRLYLKYNKLTSLSESIVNLTSLQELHLAIIK